MISTLSRTNSAASSARRSLRPSAQRYSILTLRPSFQPSSCNCCTKEATRWPSAAGVAPPKYPVVGSFGGCCARAASGQPAAAPPSSVMNARRLISNMARFPPPASAGVLSPRLLAGYRRDFKPELYPQKHGQEDQDRVQ